jgi:hypothetical protein
MDDPVSFALLKSEKGSNIYCNMLYLGYMNINNNQYIIISYIPVTRVLIQPLAFH